jgi:iron complex transport system substrate-binding protein
VRYVLTQRGTPAPVLPDIHHPLTHVLEIPLERVALGSMRCGGAADLLGVIDRLSLVTGLRAITTPSILQSIREGKTLEQYSTEMQLDREVDAVMGYYSSHGESLAKMKDRELGLNRVGMAEHLEPTPLATTRQKRNGTPGGIRRSSIRISNCWITSKRFTRNSRRNMN